MERVFVHYGLPEISAKIESMCNLYETYNAEKNVFSSNRVSFHDFHHYRTVVSNENNFVKGEEEREYVSLSTSQVRTDSFL